MKEAKLMLKGGNAKVGPILFDFIDSNGRRKSLQYERASAAGEYYRICEDELEWHPEEDNLIVRVPLMLQDPQVLFSAHGVAPSSAELGIGVEWACKGSLIRGAKKLLSFNRFQKKIDNKFFEFYIEKKTLRESLTLDVVLYLVKNDEEGSVYATIPGTILGSIYQCNLAISGDGSIFPIKEVDMPGEPLWWVECHIDDPLEDSFDSSSFCLYINKAHKGYAALGLNDCENDNGLPMEIAASALQLLVEECIKDEEYKQAILNGESSPNSVGFIVGDIINNDKIQPYIGSPSELAKAIRTYYLSE